MADSHPWLPRRATNHLNRLVSRKSNLHTTDPIRGPLRLSTLNEPTDPLVEVIFVHGLLGDSHLTWIQNNDAALFWPSWLVDDTAFAHVRVHTYGYVTTQVSKRVAVSEVNEIGLALCNDLSVNQNLNHDAHNPIIFIAHSLGGLVVKSAIIHARQNQDLRALGQRFHTTLFLATPHREANNTAMLREILSVCDTTTTNADLHDLDPRASCIEDINTAFYSNYASLYHDINIWSFYETRPSGVHQPSPIVEKRRAVFDLSEQQMRVNDDHQGAARFRSSSDPGYSTIRESLLSAVDQIRGDLVNPDRVREHMASIRAELGIPEEDDEDPTRKEKAPGSCRWLLDKDAFKDWRDSRTSSGLGLPKLDIQNTRSHTGRSRGSTKETRQLFWLTGPPGTGKTFLATEVVDHLASENCECSFYFLRHRDKNRQNLGVLLKSIACQMAERHPSIRRLLLSMAERHTFTAEANDFQTIWKQLFETGIFHVDVPRRQYWVIDALDEGKAGQDLIRLLIHVPPNYSIFLTSRQISRLENVFKVEGVRPLQQVVEKDATLRDIRAHLEHHEDYLNVDDDAERALLIDRLVEKSSGIFLWAHLVIQRLGDSFGNENMQNVIESIPEGLDSLYTRILSEIAESENAPLGIAILQWVVCAARPLTLNELRVALQHDPIYAQTVNRIERAIDSVCGQLVIVEDGKVLLVHDNVGAFLLDLGQKQLEGSRGITGSHFDLAIRKLETQARLSFVCLNYLIAGGKVVPGAQSGRNTASSENSFRKYAREFFSEHLYKSVAKEGFSVQDFVMRKLLEFLQRAVLEWIEECAWNEDLAPLTTAGKNLKRFVECCADVEPPLNSEMRTVQVWADDLIHLVTVFGRYLLANPASIHTIIPPLCPPESRIHQEFGNPAHGIEVQGLSVRTWPARISSFSYSPDYATALACCEKLYGVGLRSGAIVLYQPSTCHEVKRIPFAEPIKLLQFTRSKDFLVVSGKRTLAMFNFETGALAWKVALSHDSLALTITEDDSQIYLATKDNLLQTFNADTGDRTHSVSWETDDARERARPPQRADISSDKNIQLLALTHRNKPLALHDLRDPRPKGNRPIRYVECNASVEVVAFNPVQNALAMGSFDGDLSIIGIWNLHRIVSTTVHASHLAVSTDGETLIVGTKTGNIQIHDFLTLNLLHVIKYEDEELMGLAIESNGLRFLDIRRQIFNIWEPSALVRRKDGENSTSEAQTSFSTAPSQLVESYLRSEQTRISAISAHHSGDYIFCGRENGLITVHDGIRGRARSKIQVAERTSVTFLDWNQERQLLVSADNSGTIWVHAVAETTERSSTGSRNSLRVDPVAHKTLQHPIRQLIFSLDGDYLLVSTTVEDYILSSSDLTQLMTYESSTPVSSGAESQKWAVHSRHKRHLFGVESDEICVISGDKYSNNKMKSTKLIPESQDRFDSVTTTTNPAVRFLRFGKDMCAIYDNNPQTGPVVWSQSSSSPSLQAGFADMSIQRQNAELPEIKTIIGVHAQRLVFLNPRGWVCSAPLQMLTNSKTVNHFPTPHYWRSSTHHTLALITGKGDVVFAVAGELAIIKRALRS